MRKTLSRLAVLGLVLPLVACGGNKPGFLKIKDTVFDPALTNAEVYPLTSLLNFNFKTNELKLGAYTGTWKNRPTEKSGVLGIAQSKESITDITLTAPTDGKWTMTCTGRKKGFNLGSVSFEQDNKTDFECVIAGDAGKATLTVDPLDKPKFGLALGAQKEARLGKITVAGRGDMLLQSLHKFEGSSAESPKPYGFEIMHNGKIVAAVGTKNEKRSLLIGDVAAEDKSIVLLSALGLGFFMINDETLTR